MYAHQVIESIAYFQTLRHGKRWNQYQNILDKSGRDIVRSRKFHLGEAWDLREAFDSLMRPNDRVFWAWSDYLRMPYKTCWFDYVLERGEKNLLPDQYPVKRRGLLAHEPEQGTLIMTVFNEADAVTKGLDLPIKRVWSMSPVLYFFTVGKKITESDYVREFAENAGIADYLESYASSVGYDNMFFYPLWPIEEDTDRNVRKIRRCVEEDSTDFSVLHLALMYLNTKNVEKVRVDPPPKLQKKRRKKQKIELFTYHVLRVQTASSKREKRPHQGGATRLHYCRGHFKEYTDKNPLFGKYTGLWWWQPHIRGDAKKGRVMKDYKL
jgi:hypothetical protein